MSHWYLSMGSFILYVNKIFRKANFFNLQIVYQRCRKCSFFGKFCKRTNKWALYLLKNTENLWFSDVSKGYGKRIVAWNGLNTQRCSSEIVKLKIFSVAYSFYCFFKSTSIEYPWSLAQVMPLLIKNAEIRLISCIFLFYQ